MILATVSSSPFFHKDVRSALGSRFRFEAAWELGFEEVGRLQAVQADQKCLNIVDYSNGGSALSSSRAISGRPQIATIGVGCGESRDELLTLMQAGVRDVLPVFTARDLVEAVKRALVALDSAGESLGDLWAFVPAKPGSGATTVATNASGISASKADDPILLMDFDIRLGVTTFLLRAAGTRTIVDALQLVDRLDWDVWSGLVSQIGNLHLLGSGASDFSHHFENDRFRKLLDFALREYSVIAVDLAGLMEEFECEVMLRAKRILLVSTPDIGALHVARRKAEWFREQKLLAKVSVALTFVDRRSTLSVREIEEIIHLPVRYLLPDGKRDVAKAVQKGRILDPDCALGRQMATIAGEMANVRTGRKSSPVGRFVNYFSVSSARRRGARV